MQRGAALVVLAMTLFVASACGSGSKQGAPAGTRIVLSATQGAETARFENTTRSFGSGSDAAGATTTGAVDFTHHAGYATASAPRSGAARNASAQSEMRWIGSWLYEKSAPSAVSFPFPTHGRAWIAFDGTALAKAMHCPAQDADVASAFVLGGMGAPFGSARPDGVLEQLQKAGATLTRAGSGTVRGVTTTHWRVAFTSARSHSQPCRGSDASPLSSTPQVEIWTDTQHRLRRSRVTVTIREALGPSTSAAKRAGFVTTTDFFDFGVAVDVVAPPDATVYDSTADFVTLMRGPGQVSADAWHSIAHGAMNTKPWTIWYANTTTGWRCYDPQGTPNAGLSVIASNRMPGPGGKYTTPKHNGHIVQCAPVVDVFGGPFTTFVAGFDANTYVLVGSATSKSHAASIHFSDGTSVQAPIDAGNGLVRWSGPASSPPTAVEVDGQRCSLDSALMATPEQSSGSSPGGSGPGEILCDGTLADVGGSAPIDGFPTLTIPSGPITKDDFVIGIPDTNSCKPPEGVGGSLVLGACAHVRMPIATGHDVIAATAKEAFAQLWSVDLTLSASATKRWADMTRGGNPMPVVELLKGQLIGVIVTGAGPLELGPMPKAAAQALVAALNRDT
ncbi:MAG: hypothetical protein JWL83_2005 [Actinomycetia bacterium]|nr:hypothetical protein [Actinomycetes bacterium]